MENGLKDQTLQKHFNGIGDLACRLIAYLKNYKDASGMFYIVNPTQKDHDQEYEYHISEIENSGHIDIKIYKIMTMNLKKKLIYSCLATELKAAIENKFFEID